MKKIILSSLALVLLTLSTCSENPVTDDTLLPGRRDYTWTVDTLKVPEGRSIPSYMWGTSVNNIWALGASYTNSYAIWHYNGTSWKNYVPDAYVDPRGLWGSSSNDIWTGSTDGSIWHYNGTKWSKFQEINIPGYQTFIVQGIAGSSAKDVYAVGIVDTANGLDYKGVILRFNGVNWQPFDIPIMRSNFTEIQYASSDNEYLIKKVNFNDPIEYIYALRGNKLIEVFSNAESLANISLNRIGKYVYAVCDEKIYKYGNSIFSLLKNFKGTQYAGKIWGRSEIDFFTINWDGIGHFNGTDLITIFQKKNNDWSPDGAIIFEKDVFFIWNDLFNTFVIHGHLTN